VGYASQFLNKKSFTFCKEVGSVGISVQNVLNLFILKEYASFLYQRMQKILFHTYYRWSINGVFAARASIISKLLKICGSIKYRVIHVTQKTMHKAISIPITLGIRHYHNADKT
jgi:hypothetical protein